MALNSLIKRLLPIAMLGLIGAAFWLGNDKTAAPEVDSNISSAEPRKTVAVESETAEFKLDTELSETEKEIARQESLLSALPASLRGVPDPEELDVDENGNLVINGKIRHMFDHYLTAVGEESLETILERIQLNLEQQIDEPALSEALGILQGYVDYRSSIDQIVQTSGTFAANNFDPENVAALKQQVRISRANFFSDEVIKSFFEKEDQYDDYMLAKASIANDELLSEDEKLDALKSLQNNVPAWLIEQEVKANRIGHYNQQEQALRDSGAADWEIKDFRRRELGDQAAANLDELDQRRQDWNNRLAAYRDAVKTATAHFDDPASLEAVIIRDRIREDHFSDHELRRVTSLDQLSQQD